MAAPASAPARADAESRAALLALGFVLAVTAAWWALALWPTPGAPPEWLERARWVCFNVGPSGLPDAAGWLLLIGQPLGFVALLLVAFGGALRRGVAELLASRAGRALAVCCAASIAVGLAAAGARVASVSRFDASAGGALAAETPPETYPRLDRPAPALGLLDQRGERIDVASLAGRPALVTFAFAHCETVCPALVSQALAAQRTLRESGAPAERVPRIAIVTLDPWRDTPARLPALAESWRLPGGDEALVLSGEVAAVNAALDRWNVPRARNDATGQLDHPALVYVIDSAGRIAYAANGDAASLTALLARL
jgi:cytochrome oxidase Cu insertion factor (SCO1/SenC/PrrC family)